LSAADEGGRNLLRARAAPVGGALAGRGAGGGSTFAGSTLTRARFASFFLRAAVRRVIPGAQAVENPTDDDREGNRQPEPCGEQPREPHDASRTGSGAPALAEPNRTLPELAGCSPLEQADAMRQARVTAFAVGRAGEILRHGPADAHRGPPEQPLAVSDETEHQIHRTKGATNRQEICGTGWR